MAHAAGLATRAAARGGAVQVVNRIVMEELEAWFFGDPEAVAAAYSRVAQASLTGARYRDPDHIAGGTWEALAAILRRAGYHSSVMPKTEVAREISRNMDPERNRSRGFQVFRAALLELVRADEETA